MSLSLRTVGVLVALLASITLALLWTYASVTNDEKLHAFRLSIREQGPSRGGRPPTDDEVQTRTQESAEQLHVTASELSVESSDTQGLPGALGHTEAGLAVMNAVQVTSRVFTVRGRARARTLLWSREEQFEAQFSVRLSVTMAPSIETHAPALPSERAAPRGL